MTFAGVEAIQLDESMTVDDAASASVGVGVDDAEANQMEIDIAAGESFQVPLMLIESSLHVRGNHLGEFAGN